MNDGTMNDEPTNDGSATSPDPKPTPHQLSELSPVIYDELRRLAASQLAYERAGHTLQPTALVHEVFLRLVDQRNLNLKSRAQFFAVAARMMRRILVDHARSKRRAKRGGDRDRIPLNEDLTISSRNDEDVLDVDHAIEKLAKLDETQAKIVELRFFAGMTVAEVAEVLQLSERTVERQWTAIRAWLRRELGDANP